MNRAYSFITLVVALLLCTSCAGVSYYKPKADYKPNYLVIHPDGYALDDHNEQMSTALLKHQLETELVPHIFSFVSDMPQSPAMSSCVGSDRVLRLLIFVHGGLNGYDTGFEHMSELLEEVTASNGKTRFHVIKGSCYYPLFINWNSDGLDSMVDDLFRIRFGHPDMALAILSSPFVLTSRLIGSLANLPVSLIHNGDLLRERIRGAIDEGDPGYCVAADTAGYLPLHALYVATIPLVEGFGAPAWDIMKRRAQLAVADQLTDEPGVQNATLRRFYPSGRETTQRTSGQFLDEGAFRTVLTVLHSAMRYDNGTWTWRDTDMRVEVTLVGHSMGAMLLNRILGLLQGVQHSQETPVENLVYLAPAAPVDELDFMAAPYLERVNRGTRAKSHPTRLHMFTLNRRDETREIDWIPTLGLLPRGSLLTWIDTFLERETTWGQSTSGRTWNLLHTYGLEPVPTFPGTRNCFTPSWDPVHGPPPEQRPLVKQFRERMFALGSTHRALQDRDLLKLYDAPRRIGDHTVPENHGDFTVPRYFLEALCQVNDGAFRTKDYCQQRPGAFDP